MRLVLVVLLAGLAGAAPPAGVADGLQSEGGYATLGLPPGSSDVLVSRDGTLAAIATVTFDRGAGKPARVLQVIDPAVGRVTWRRSLPSPSCCAFPVLAMTPEGDAIALGGGEQTFVYDRWGTRRFAAGLDDGRLHSAAGVDDAGRRLVVGAWEGTLAAFELGRARLWVHHVDKNVMAVAVSGRGGVAAAALRDRLLLLRLRDGTLLHEIPYGPARIAAIAVSSDGDVIALAWKRDDGRMVAEVIAAGRRRWRRDLGPGSVPLLQMDERGRWLAVGDLLGRQAALLGPAGQVTWIVRRPARGAAAVAPDGRWFATAQGSVVEIRMLPSGRTVWGGRLPGTVHLLRLAGRWLAVLSSTDSDAGIPDRVSFVELSLSP